LSDSVLARDALPYGKTLLRSADLNSMKSG
jgi:hypothetical protein